MHVPAHEEPAECKGTKCIKLYVSVCTGLCLHGQVGCPIDLHAEYKMRQMKRGSDVISCNHACKSALQDY